jgi:hypothetical protein
MAAIGNSPTQQAFTPAIDYFSGNGSTTAFTLSRPVASVAQVQVTIDNVAQNPSSAYTVSANTITFTSAPLSGTNNIYVYYTSPITQVIAPGQGTVNTTALGNITNIASGNSSLTLQTGSSPTTAVTVNTSQNVGIGTTNPDFGSYGAGERILGISNPTSGTRARLSFQNLSTGTSGISGTLAFFNGSTILGSIDVGADGATNKGYYAFYTNNGTSNSERMRISSAGYVGIGVTNPVGLGQLEVQAPSTGAGLWVQTGGTNSGYTIAEFRTGTNAPALQVYGDASSTFGGTISSNITPGKYTIDASNLGVGTSIANNGTVDFASASGMLVVNNWSTGGVTIYICGGGSTVNVSSVSGTVGTFSYQASVNGYRWTNNYGSTATFGFFFVRTRSGA